MLKAFAVAVAVMGATAVLQGCAYDPATGTYVPCCAYPAVYPAYPAYGYYPPVVGSVVVGGGWRGGWYRW